MNSLLKKIKSRKAIVCIVGVGYVGLPNTILFAEKGFNVIAADISETVVNSLKKGKSHVRDPVLEKTFSNAFKTGRITATTNIAQAIRKADVVILSVPTPTKRNQPDLRFIKASCKAIGKNLNKNKLVVIESTVYPSACRLVVKPILEKESGLKCGKDFFLAHCPERLNPSDYKHSIRNTVRVVGGYDKASGDVAELLYKQIIDAMVFRVSNLDTAELVKLVENTQRDLNIAFVNEVALICEKIGVDAKEVVDACSTKWNFYRLLPGPGVGGHCLPNNPYYILRRSKECGFTPRLIMMGRQVNDSMPSHVVKLIEDGLLEAGRSVKDSKICLLGVAYKANIDDVRMSPAHKIAKELRRKKADLVIHDPHVRKANALKVHDKVVKSLKEALKADCLVFLCAHDEYKKIDLNKTKASVIVDAAFLFDKEKTKKVYKRPGLGKISD